MATLKGFGERIPNADTELRFETGKPEVQDAVLLYPPSRGSNPNLEVQAQDDDLVEVELENGVIFWTLMGELRQRSSSGLARSGESQEEFLPTTYGGGRRSQRGIDPFGVAITALKILKAPRFLAWAAAKQVESKLLDPPGIYAFTPDGLRSEPFPKDSKPVLVFIHGTASSTTGAFKRLFPFWEKLRGEYGDRIFGFEHRTFSESPVQNAVQFLEALPAGPLPPLHLVSHSRGGLVGDLVALGAHPDPFPIRLLEAFRIGTATVAQAKLDRWYREERRAFEQLHNLLLAKKPVVQRFVRIAAPAGGTAMASERLDLYVSLLFRFASLTPGLGPFVGALGELVTAVAQEKQDPTILPGIEAQSPQSQFIRLLNGAHRELDSDLTVIAGDCEGTFKGMADYFFYEANDLVVDSRSMLRGVPRKRSRWYCSGGDVHHLNYFGDEDTVTKLVAGLKRADGDEFGFSTGDLQTEKPRQRGMAERSRERIQQQLILVPGCFESHLRWTGSGLGERLWLDLQGLITRGPGGLELAGDGANLVADGALEPLKAHFESILDEQLVPFAYDWRLSVAEAANRLADFIATKLQSSVGPVGLLAHGSGIQVVRFLIAEHRELWNEFRKAGGRLIQAGGLEQVGPKVVKLLQGQGRLARQLAALHGSRLDWIKVMSGFPGLLELVPSNLSAGDVWRPAEDRDGWVGPDQTHLDRARSALVPSGMVQLENEGFTSLGGLAEAVEEDVDSALEVFPSRESLERAALGIRDEEGLRPPAAKAVRCTVKVVHGDLAYAKYPVMVGHYSGNPILSAEAALDRHLDGRLSDRHLLDLYPREIGSHEVIVKWTGGVEHLQGAIVVGLGEAGSLSGGGLTRTVTEALVRYVCELQERADLKEGQKRLGVTSLLIGSGEAGLSMGQVLQSILLGVRLANQRLVCLAPEGQEPAGIATLELLELYQDRSIEALHSLLGLKRLAFRDMGVVEELETAAGGRRRASFGEPGGWWTPLLIRQVKGEPAGILEFTFFGNRARAVPEKVETQVDLVNQLLNGSMSADRSRLRQLSETLFELLMPQRLKRASGDQRNILLMVDPATAVYPWEMLIDRHSPIGRRPIGVDAGLVRQLKLEAADERARLKVNHPEAIRVLVVGDPPSGFPGLDGAREEAETVADLFEERSWIVTRQIRADRRRRGIGQIDAESIICAAMSEDHRVLHLAGHGVYDSKKPSRSGMVLAGSPGLPESQLLFSPAEVRQMRLVPELVFINCCSLGRIQETPPHLLAANLATQFIRNGVKAVVAAGWAVEDQVAVIFAQAFYASFFDGATFGSAVTEARQAAYDASPNSNTWAAYQCYGDPGFRLVTDRGSQTQASRNGDEVDPAEMVADLDNFVSRIRCEQTPSKLEGIRKSLAEAARTAVKKNWLKRGEVAAALGRAYGELGDFQAANRYYEMARTSDQGAVTLRDLEQLANLRARWAAVQAKGGHISREAGEGEIRRSIVELQSLLNLGYTQERAALLASTAKRQVIARPSAAIGEVAIELRAMAEGYALTAVKNPENLYCGINALSATLLLGGPVLPGAGSPSSNLAVDNPFSEAEFFENRLKLYRELAARHSKADVPGAERDFWSQTYLPDVELVAAIWEERKGGYRPRKLVPRYETLFKNFGSPLQHDSVIAQIEFLDRFIGSKHLEELRQRFSRTAI